MTQDPSGQEGSSSELPPPAKLNPGQSQTLTIRLNLRTEKPLVTSGLIALTVLVYLLQLYTQARTGEDLPALFGAKINSLIYQGQFWRLLTPVFLHLSILHIGINMWMLYLMGRALEPFYGHTRFLLLYLTGAFTGNVFSFIFQPNPSVGAAAGLFSLLIAYGVLVLQNRAVIGERSKRMLMDIAIVVLLNLSIGLIPRVDISMGIGGFFGGLAYAWFAGPLWGVRPNGLDLDIGDVRSDRYAFRVALFQFAILSALVMQRLLIQ